MINKGIHIVLLFVLMSFGVIKAENVRHFYPGDEVSMPYILEHGVGQFFKCVEVPDTIFALMMGKTYGKGCTVARRELRYILCLHIDADGRHMVGEMVLNKRIAKDVLEILRALYNHGYPIERMRLPDYWNAVDENVMRDNNSSGFNFRYVSHTKKVSKHGLGMAVDINPLYNPYHKYLRNGKEVVEPSTATAYLNRKLTFKYKIIGNDLCVRLFKNKGFKWGGDWKNSKDYQHFEK